VDECDQITGPLVLIIHHDANVARRLASLLQATGYITHTATDALDGLQAVEQHPPSVILLDWHLPFIDGVVFLRALHTWTRAMPPVVALITDSDDPAGIQQAGSGAVLIPAAATNLTRVVHLVTHLVPLDCPDGGAI
jgi:CheY-like chemotaxis protein